MAIYKVQGPDGQQHQIEGPDGASDAEIISQAQKLLGGDKLPDAVEADKVGLEEPPEQKLLNNLNAVGSGMGVAQLAGGAVELGMKGASAATEGVRGGVSKWLGKKAEEQAVKSYGPTTTNLAEIGSPDDVRALGRYGLDKGIVTGGATPEEMMTKINPLNEAAGKTIGETRSLAGERGSPLSAKAISEQIRSRLGSKYGNGLYAGESGQFGNALNELTKQDPKTFSELSSAATDMNAFAKERNSLMQPTGATTDVANSVASTSDAGIKSLLTDPEQAAYAGAKEEFGQTQNIGHMVDRTQYRTLANGVTMPVSHLGVMQRGLNMVVPHTRIATAADKISKALQTNPQAFGKNSQIIGEAIKRGKGALGSVIYMLQQQDPEFKQQMTDMNNER